MCPAHGNFLQALPNVREGFFQLAQSREITSDGAEDAAADAAATEDAAEEAAAATKGDTPADRSMFESGQNATAKDAAQSSGQIATAMDAASSAVHLQQESAGMVPA